MEFKVENYNQYINNPGSIWVGAGNKLVYGVHPCTKETLLKNVRLALKLGYDEVCMGHYLRDFNYINEFYTKLKRDELSKIIYRISSSNLDRDINILYKLKGFGITFNKIYISNISTNINLDIFRLNLLYDNSFKYVSYANCLNSYLKEIEETRKEQERLDYLIGFTVQYIDNALSNSYEGRELYVWGLNQYREDKKKDISKAKDSIISSYKKLKKIKGENINIILGSNHTNRIKENLELFKKYFKK